MENTAILILAAGQGTRMNSDLPKVLHRTTDMPLISHVLNTAAELEPERVVVITGHGRGDVESHIRGNHRAPEVRFAVQAEQNGTGHAVQCALSELEGFNGTVLILFGDVPLISAVTLKSFLSQHSENKATISVLTFITRTPGAYGRIVRDENSEHINAIVEAKDCSVKQLQINEVNSGIFAVDSAFLVPAVKELKNENAQGEYYLVDIVKRAADEGQTVCGMVINDESEVWGVNTPLDLARVNQALNIRRIEGFLSGGVTVLDPYSTWIGKDVVLEKGLFIGPNVQIQGNSVIGANTKIEGSAFISNAKIGAGSHIKIGSRIEEATTGEGVSVGPFAHLRPGTELADEVKIGNFVETKKAVLKRGAKASHLTYLGDCEVGEEANVGAGTITCNYDGYNKHRTEIGAGAFIGSNTSLVAPVTIEQGATIGAGSTITKNVKKDSLAFTRAPQVSKDGWSKSKRKKMRG